MATALLEMLLIVYPQILQLTSPDADHLLFTWTCVATAAAMLLTWLWQGREGQAARRRGGSLGSHPLSEQEQMKDERRRSPTVSPADRGWAKSTGEETRSTT